MSCKERHNAGAHLLPEAGARHERTLEAVRCSALFGCGASDFAPFGDTATTQQECPATMPLGQSARDGQHSLSRLPRPWPQVSWLAPRESHHRLARLSGNLPPSGLKGITRSLKAQDLDIRPLPKKCIH